MSRRPDAASSSPGERACIVCWLIEGSGADLVTLDPVDARLAGALAVTSIQAEGAESQGLGTPPSHRGAAFGSAAIARVANDAAAEHPDADLVLVLGDVELPAGWLECLRASAATESTTATVSPLPGEALARIGWAQSPLPAPSPPSHESHAYPPRTGLVTSSCVYITRASFDLLGGIDETLSTGASAITDFGLRARALGLANLLADDLLVPVSAMARLTADDRDELARRHPRLYPAASGPPSSAVERRLLLASTRLRGLSVTIDARSLGAGQGGTQAYVRELIRAIAGTGELQVRVLLGTDDDAGREFDELPQTSTISYEQALRDPSPTDLVHRPQQVFTIDDLTLLKSLGRRQVITHLDLIAYHNPSYFAETALWERHVRATSIALSAADHVVFLSTHALRDAVREDLIDEARATVVSPGVDPTPPLDTATVQPKALADRDEPFLLCLGADYAHKNRPFALELTAELRRAHGWPGILVLAGPHVECGSSRDAEEKLRERHTELANASVDLGPISEPERRWLMTRSRALAYPTVEEGFGFVPFEAAAVEIPCLFAGQGSLAELLPTELATFDGWSLQRSAALAAALLEEGPERTRHIEGLRRASRAYTWQACAERMMEVYRRTLESRAQSSADQAWEAAERELEIKRLDRAFGDINKLHRDFVDTLGEDGLALVGPNALLSQGDRHALLAVAARPALRRVLFAAILGSYRVMHALKRSDARRRR